MNRIIRRLLHRNLSRAQLAGFVISNFTGLAIIILGLQFFIDARPIWDDEDSFIRKDYIVINKRITGANTLGNDASFTPAEINDLQHQPWVRRVGKFTSADFQITASVATGSHRMSTYMFLEAIPTGFIDVTSADWTYTPGSHTVPIIISKDYLSLYNFGFASTVGMPTVSENTIKAIPLTLTILPDDNRPPMELEAHITGFSNRLNTILVPEEFMTWSNATFGSGTPPAPSRLIVDVNSPGDIKITRYLEAHDLEVAGDKSGSQASFLVNVIAAIALIVGVVITVLSFFILLLSISLLMQKNRDKIHSLIMLGVNLPSITKVYVRLVAGVNALAFVLAAGGMLLLRMSYLPSLAAMGGAAGSIWPGLAAGLAITLLLTLLNALSIHRRVARAFLNEA